MHILQVTQQHSYCQFGKAVIRGQMWVQSRGGLENLDKGCGVGPLQYKVGTSMERAWIIHPLCKFSTHFTKNINYNSMFCEV